MLIHHVLSFYMASDCSTPHHSSFLPILKKLMSYAKWKFRFHVLLPIHQAWVRAFCYINIPGFHYCPVLPPTIDDLAVSQDTLRLHGSISWCQVYSYRCFSIQWLIFWSMIKCAKVRSKFLPDRRVAGKDFYHSTQSSLWAIWCFYGLCMLKYIKMNF